MLSEQYATPNATKLGSLPLVGGGQITREGIDMFADRVLRKTLSRHQARNDGWRVVVVPPAPSALDLRFSYSTGV